MLATVHRSVLVAAGCALLLVALAACGSGSSGKPNGPGGAVPTSGGAAPAASPARTAGQRHVRPADLGGAYVGLIPTSLAVPFHPNALGEQAMAEEILRVLR